MKKKLFKRGYYTFYESNGKYVIDNGKTIYLPNLKKTVINKSREIKEFTTLVAAKKYADNKLSKYKKRKTKKLKKLPRTLYLILIKEDSTNSLFVKVGITSKKLISRRFGKQYGYDGYHVNKILRKIVTKYDNARKLEKKILTELNKKWSIKKYRPLLESFSGYSECYNYLSLKNIIKVFDQIVINETREI